MYNTITYMLDNACIQNNWSMMVSVWKTIWYARPNLKFKKVAILIIFCVIFLTSILRQFQSSTRGWSVERKSDMELFFSPNRIFLMRWILWSTCFLWAISASNSFWAFNLSLEPSTAFSNYNYSKNNEWNNNISNFNDKNIRTWRRKLSLNNPMYLQFEPIHTKVSIQG